MNLLNQKNVLILASAVVLAFVGSYFYQQNCDQKEQSAKSALYQVQKTLETEVAALTAEEKTAGAKMDIDAKLPKTVAGYHTVISSHNYPDRVRYEAGLKLASLYLEHSKDDALEKPIAILKQVPEFAKTSFQKSTALFLLGSAQERSKQLKEALDTFQKALNEENEGLKAELLLSLVRLHLQTNNATQAKAYADKLNKEAPGSKAAQEAQKLISKT